MKSKFIALRPSKYITLASAAALSFGQIAKADINIDFSYDNVTGTTTAYYTGTWNSSAYTTGFSTQFFIDSNTFYDYDGSVGVSYVTQTFVTPWAGKKYATGHSGSGFGFDATSVYGSPGFNSATPLNGSLIFAGTTIADLGFSPQALNEGFGSFSLGAPGMVNWSINGAAIPEPSSCTVILGIFGFGIAMMRRRRAHA